MRAKYIKQVKNRIQSILILVTLLLVPLLGIAQETQNYIIQKTYLTETTESTAGSDHKSISVSFYDGLGRPIQNVQVGASPDGNDIVQHMAYDEMGRESRKYLPYVSTESTGLYKTTAESDQLNFYDNPVDNIAGSTRPWSDVVFDDSPLNRVVEQGAPGETWKAVKDDTNDHSVHFSYAVNTSSDLVKRFTVDSNNNLEVGDNYAESSLYKNETRDENGNWSEEYKDFLGQVVLKVGKLVTEEPGVTITQFLKTYYVYDDFGLLRYVIPPKASELINTTELDTSDAVIKNLCYYYEYDGRKRMVLKKLPGVDPVYMVYDNRDRLVLTQDGNLRTEDKWMFTKYDELNRPALTGVYQHDARVEQDSMQAIVNDQMVNFYEDINGNYSSADFGYTNQSFPVLDANDEILTVTYYDKYDFDKNWVIRDYASSIDNADYDISDINYAVKGQVTGTLTKVLGTTDHYLLSVNFYDDKYRVIRTYAENYLGGDDLLLTKYDFTGHVLKTHQIHVKDAGATPIDIHQRMEYDHAFRLLEVYHQIGNNPADEILLAQMEYNELGQLISKKLHDGIQDVNFEYNIRGWLTKINDPENLSDDLFAMQLAYNEEQLSGLTTMPQYNGNISAIKWNNSEEASDHTYAFNYDNVNRITRGDHFENNETPTTKFDLDNVSYDKNGNITSLTRYGKTGLIDNLTYTYTDATLNYTNQLQQVADASTTDGFADGVNTGADYDYDANGNLTEDYNKGIVDIRYNYLNLPEEIEFDDGNIIRYIYDAAGVKLAKLVTGTSTGNRFYMGNFEYKNDTSLDMIHTDEGRVRWSGTEYLYDYYLKDHLGNTRVMFTDNAGQAEVLQVDNYYPFGMRFNQAPVLQAEANNYLYNGKELQEDHGLDWYDYGARFYDAAIARWHVVDPMAEERLWLSPYNYCSLNPINRIDPDGMLDDEWQYNVDSDELTRTGSLGGNEKQFVTITDNDQNVLGNASVNGAQVYVDEYEINNSESVVSVSNAPNNAKNSALKNTGSLIGKSSPLSNDAKQSLMTSSIHKAQVDFGVGALSVTSHAVGKIGTGATIVGYGASMFPGGQAVGAGLIGIGKGMTTISGAIDLGMNLSDGNYGKAGISIATMAAGSIIGTKIDAAKNLGRLGDQGATILKTGADLKLDLLNTVGNATIDKINE